MKLPGLIENQAITLWAFCGHLSGIGRILLGNGRQQAVDMIDSSPLLQEWGSGGRSEETEDYPGCQRREGALSF